VRYFHRVVRNWIVLTRQSSPTDLADGLRVGRFFGKTSTSTLFRRWAEINNGQASAINNGGQITGTAETTVPDSGCPVKTSSGGNLPDFIAAVMGRRQSPASSYVVEIQTGSEGH